jgi:succinate dehydrogenase / fumarate reductase membrane anchor subunit
MTHAQGLRTWLMQRLSAVYMAAYLIFFLLSLSLKNPHGYAQWRAFMTAHVMSAATLLLFLFLLIHAWVGMRDVIMDYVRTFNVRLAVLTLIAVGLIAMGSWLFLVLLRAG